MDAVLLFHHIMADQELAAALVTADHYIVASRCLTFAGFTVLVFDHLTTFSQEVSRVWSRRMNLVSLMFLFNRYLTPLVLALDIYDKSGLASPLTRSFCTTWLLLEGYITILSFSIIHGLVAMRVCAIYEQKRWVVTLLSLAFIAYLGSTLSLATAALVPQARVIKPTHPFNVCYAPTPRDLWAVWLPSLLFECNIFILTIFRVLHYIGRDVSTPVARLMYRDGILYFLVMGSNSLLCLLDWVVSPSIINALAKYFGYAICVCASCKLVLSLRGLSPGTDVWTMTYESPDAIELSVPSTSASAGTSVSPLLPPTPRPQSPTSIRDRLYTGTVQALPRLYSASLLWRHRSVSPEFATGLPNSHSDIYQRLCTDINIPTSMYIAQDSIPMADLDVHAPCQPAWREPKRHT